MHLIRYPSNQLSSGTSRSSGYKHCRVVQVVRVDTSLVESTINFFRVEKCISLGRQGPKQSVVETNSDSTETVTAILHCTADLKTSHISCIVSLFSLSMYFRSQLYQPRVHMRLLLRPACF